MQAVRSTCLLAGLDYFDWFWYCQYSSDVFPDFHLQQGGYRMIWSTEITFSKKQSLLTLNRRNFVATCAVTKLHKATTSWSNWYCTANHMHCIVVICYEPVSRDKWIISSHKLVHLTKNLILIRDRNCMFSPQLRKGSRSQSFLEPICELDILIIPHKQILCNLDIWIYLVTIAVLPNLYVFPICKYICIVF